MFNRGTDKTKVEQFVKVEEKLPNILISPLAISKMSRIVNYCDDEIGWLASAEQIDEYVYHIKDVFMFEQEVNSITCEITPDGLANFGTEILSKENGMELYEQIRVWGHSHVNMGVSPSGQDDKQITEFSEGHDWFIRIIANKKKEMKIDLFDYKNNLVYLSVDWEVYYNEFEEELKELEKQIDRKVTQKATSWKRGNSTKVKAKKEEYNLLNYHYGNYSSQPGEVEGAYDCGYYDAMMGVYDATIYKNNTQLLDCYNDGFKDYEDTSGIDMHNIYNKVTTVNEVIACLSKQDKEDLRGLPYYEFRTAIIDFYGVSDWMYSDFKELEAEVKKER